MYESSVLWKQTHIVEEGQSFEKQAGSITVERICLRHWANFWDPQNTPLSFFGQVYNIGIKPQSIVSLCQLLGSPDNLPLDYSSQIYTGGLKYPLCHGPWLLAEVKMSKNFIQIPLIFTFHLAFALCTREWQFVTFQVWLFSKLKHRCYNTWSDNTLIYKSSDINCPVIALRWRCQNNTRVNVNNLFPNCG